MQNPFELGGKVSIWRIHWQFRFIVPWFFEINPESIEGSSCVDADQVMDHAVREMS